MLLELLNKHCSIKNKRLLLANTWTAAINSLKCASQFQPQSFPRTKTGHLMHDESRVPGIWQLIEPPGHLQAKKIAS